MNAENNPSVQEGNVKEPVPVPAWLVNLVKLSLTVVVSVSLAYARFAATESKAVEAIDMGKENAAKLEAKSEVINQLTAQVGRMDIKETMMEKSIGDSLARIESSVKDLRTDVKEIQARQQSKP